MTRPDDIYLDDEARAWWFGLSYDARARLLESFPEPGQLELLVHRQSLQTYRDLERAIRFVAEQQRQAVKDFAASATKTLGRPPRPAPVPATRARRYCYRPLRKRLKGRRR